MSATSISLRRARASISHRARRRAHSPAAHNSAILATTALRARRDRASYSIILQIGAVLLIAISVISLAFIGKEKRTPKMATRGVLFACATACFIAIYSVLDAIGARVSQDPLAYVAALMALDFLPIAIFFLYCNRGGEDKKSMAEVNSPLAARRYRRVALVRRLCNRGIRNVEGSRCPGRSLARD